MKGSSDILSQLALHHNSQFRCRQPLALAVAKGRSLLAITQLHNESTFVF